MAQKKTGIVAEIRKRNLGLVVENLTARDIDAIAALAAERKKISQERLIKALKISRGAKRSHFRIEKTPAGLVRDQE